MNYTKEFIKKCKDAYPDWKELHEALDNGRQIVGRYLDDARYGSIDVEDILNATSLKELQDKVIDMKKRNELYGEWLNMEVR